MKLTLEKLVHKHKKVTSTLAAVLFAIGLGGTQLSCAPTYQQIVTSIEQRDTKVRQDLEDISRSVYCVAIDSKYALKDNPEVSETYRFTGTAFAYAKKGEYTYLITANHVVTRPSELIQTRVNLDFTGLLPPRELERLVYQKTQEEIRLVDNFYDHTSFDDIKLELFAVDTEKDIAILRTKQEIHVSNKYSVDLDLKPQLGNQVFLSGYLKGDNHLTTEGTVVNLHQNFQEKEFLAIEVTATTGNSGSPYFIRKGDRLYWAGICTAIQPYKNTSIPIFSLGFPIQNFDYLLR
ncbi:trypsin-like peptidase domain-containing protein [Candidatus Woesearchaeota archaeon]|nr:trypsin-like peptidase domain-containing protein [Candidatus Woesearchaeota archaeon]